MKHSERAGSTFSLVLIAGLAGAAAALLLSPRSGKENRDNIRNSIEQAKGTAQDNLAAAKSKVSEHVTTAKDMKDRISTAITDTKSDTQKNIDAARNDIQSQQQEKPYFNNWNREE